MVTAFSLPDVVDLNSVRDVAEGLTRHIKSSPAPVLDASRLERADLPLLQVLVAGKRLAQSLGKPFSVADGPNGPLADLLSVYGLDPVLCGMPAGDAARSAAVSTQRI